MKLLQLPRNTRPGGREASLHEFTNPTGQSLQAGSGHRFGYSKQTLKHITIESLSPPSPRYVHGVAQGPLRHEHSVRRTAAGEHDLFFPEIDTNIIGPHKMCEAFSEAYLFQSIQEVPTEMIKA